MDKCPILLRNIGLIILKKKIKLIKGMKDNNLKVQRIMNNIH
jgi:hypothetical protein